MARYQFSYGEDDSSSESESKSASSSKTSSSTTKPNSQFSNPLPRASTPPFTFFFNESLLLDPNFVNKKPISPPTPPQSPTSFNLHPGITPRRTPPSKRSLLPPLTPSKPIISHIPTSYNRPQENTPSHSPSPSTRTITSPSSTSQKTCTCTCTPTLTHHLHQTTHPTSSNRDQTARLLTPHTLYRENRDEQESTIASLQKLTRALEKIIDATTWYRSLIETQEREISEAETKRQEAERKSQEMEEKMGNLERELEVWRGGWEESERRAGGL
ncbi:uncharacterized protein EAE97_009139 [Botrytis byssoidea]|uniref:Uncharacterized protein n=1 Tax=Botrytis byssoidea TaxID=139641 RepID=A0A9P5LNJ3_9HELO|nr:uncharacterized protein EAE97_009139 [Botrytis byssoidea]KAF7932118.1 hypothetical protein EAE97_009139 [Botrytis byssoidea]